MDSNKIASTAVISSSAKIGNNVTIGDYVIVGDNVEIGDDTVVEHHAVISCNTKIGKGCTLYPFCSIGTDPQDITFKGEETFVTIGDNNKIREFVTINRGTAKGGGLTSVGNNNYIMAYAHIAHDCHLGNNIIMINSSALAGHVEVEDAAVIGANSSVHQFVRIGKNCYIGGYTVVLQDILPFAKVAQSRKDFYNFYGPNSIGMMRNGISRDFIHNVKEIFKIIYRSNLNTSQAIDKIRDIFETQEEADIIVNFINRTKRGILKNFDFNS